MPIVAEGTTNLSALTVPNIYVQIVPPNPLLNGVPTNVIGIVGSASWGPKNSPVTVGNIQNGVIDFGTPNPIKHDLMTAVYAASLQGASSFRCVRVTDGTDTSASGNLMDDALTPQVGATLTAIYTGSVGNTISAVIARGSSYTPSVPTYRLSIYIAGGIPEVYDNIGGTGNEFWQNLVSAVNSGQSVARGPSQLCVATLGSGITAVVVTAQGTYTAVPTVSATVGTGATFAAKLEVLPTSTLVSGGTGYADNDTITLNTGGGTTTPVVLTVLSQTGGVIDTFEVTNPGVLTSGVPSNPVSQSSTSGTGTGATFNLNWGLNSISVLTPGTGYTDATVLNISDSGGGAADPTVGSVTIPGSNTTTLTGGSDGSTNVTSTTLVGNDASNPRTGMYALRNSTASIVFLADADDPTKWTLQNEFGLEEGCYVIGTIAPGYQDNIDGAATLLQTAGINSYAFTLMTGDWVQFNDPFNNLTRFISPQSWKAGILAQQLPSNSSLNKAMAGVVATQKSAERRSYADADLSQLRISRLEVITNPIPAGNLFGCRLGINTSSNPLAQTDNYTRMVNFLAKTIIAGMGGFVGLPQTPTVRAQALALINTFLQNLFQAGMIGDVNQPGNAAAAFKVVLDESNNPPNRVALGYMQADVTVVLFSIVQYFVINLNATQGSQVQILPPQVGG